MNQVEPDKIIYINKEGKALLFDGEKFDAQLPNKTAEYVVTTNISLEHLQNYGYKSPSNISQEKLEIQAEIKMYDDGGLDVDAQYSIDFQTIPLPSGNEIFVNVFAVREDFLKEKYQEIAKQFGYVDIIAPIFTKYEVLYTHQIIEPKNDLFIYFSENESYVTMFKDAHFLSFKSLPSLRELSQKAKVEYDQFMEFLTTRGLKKENYELDDVVTFSMLEETFTKVVEVISHSIGHKRGLYGYADINHFFLDFQSQNIEGFLELFVQYGFENSTFEPLKVFKKLPENQREDALNALYLLDASQGACKTLNFTIFEKKPAFYKTKSGTFLSVLAFSLIAALVYPTYALINLSVLNKKEEKLQLQYNKLMQETKRLKAVLKKAKSKKQKLQQSKEKLNNKIQLDFLFVEKLKKIKQNSLQRQQTMQDVDGLLSKYKLLAKDINQTGSSTLSVTILSTYNNSETIALFMKDMLLKGYKSVDTRAVDLKNASYESVVKIQR